MKVYIFGIIMNFIAAFCLFSSVPNQLSNFSTAIPAILCIIAGIFGLKQAMNDYNKNE